MTLRIDDGVSVRTLPPPPPPPAKTDTVQQGDTVQSVAARNHVSAQDLTAANHITPQATLNPGQVLTIPESSSTSTPANDSTPPATTPQQRVDQAVAKYDAAVKANDSAAIAQARQDVYAAVRAEIGPQVDAANANIPPQYRTLTQDQINSYGNVILRRHGNDPTAQGVLKDAIGDYQIQRKADDLIPQFYGNFTPKEKLDSLKLSLQGQPPEVLARAMQNPSVQQMLKDAVAWVAEPYKGVSADAAKENQQAALEASQRLADVTKGLPPADAQRIVQQTMPTIQKIAGVDANYSGSGAFTNLSNVVTSLGQGPQAQALTNQIAQAYQGQFQTWEGRFDDTHAGIIKFAVGSGTSPKLSLALAAQLNATGHADQAGVVLRSIERGVEDLQYKIKQDMSDYSNQLGDLSWVVATSKGKLTDAQLHTAINNYIQGQPQEWRDKLQSTERQLTSDAVALNADIGALQSVDPGLRQTAPDAFDALNNNVGKNQTTAQAIKFAASRDPGMFATEDGFKAGVFWTEEADRGMNMTDAVLSNYLSGNVLPQIKGMNPSDPASVAKVNGLLDDFNERAKQLGVPPQEADAGIAQLKQLVRELPTTGPIDAHSLEPAKEELERLKELSFTSGAVSMAYRTLGFGLAGAAALNQIQGTINDPTLQNILGSLGNASGAVQDGVGFAASIDLINPEGKVGGWGLATSTAGKVTEKFVGALDAAYFTAGAVSDFRSGNITKGAFEVAGATGAVMATVGDVAGVAAWVGPVGWGITIIATGGMALAEHRQQLDHHTDIENSFLKGAGLDDTAAQALSSDAAQEATTLQQQLNLSPDQMQTLAKTHPEVFDQGAGYTQAVIAVAKASGIQGGDVQGFIDAIAQDALAKGNPNYLEPLYANNNVGDGAHPLSKQATLFDIIQQGYPTAARFVQQHSPGLVGPAADARRRADSDYEYSTPDSRSIGNLLKSHNDPAYQTEIIRLMKQNDTLGHFVQSVSTLDRMNGWPEAAKSAIQAAQNAGVLAPAQAQNYLEELG